PEATPIVRNLDGEAIALDSLQAFLQTSMAAADVPGLSMAIINDGRIVYHLVAGLADVEHEVPVTDETIFEGASMSKPLFAYLIMTLVDDGLLDLDQPLYTYLENPDLADDERYRRITARMVLSHTTGLPNWRRSQPEGKLRIQFEPGTAYQYSGEAYQYLAEVAAQVLGTDYRGLGAYFQERVARPCGLQPASFFPDSALLAHKAIPYINGERMEWIQFPPAFGAAYGIHAEAVGYAHWLIALLDERGLEKESFAELFRPQVPLPADDYLAAAGVTDWTLGFARAEIDGHTLYAHTGKNPGFSGLFLISRDQQWGFVMFANANQAVEFELAVFNYLHDK
ncbi:MAG: beta-lactamase family protein, partial [Lewinella sp.]|nr:beta-lactamase family protein [Lewinella sp.]